MSDQDIFNEEINKDNDPQKATPDVDPQKQPSNDFNQMLGMIVNAEGEQKYGNVEDALKGAAHAQTHIAKIESELAELRNANTNSAKLDDVMNALQSQNEPDQSNSDNGITMTDIQRVVQESLNNANEETARKTNIANVAGKFKELYGEKASETLYGKAEDLGLNREEINSLISKNPKAALKVLGIEEGQQKQTINTDTSSVNTSGFEQSHEPELKSSMGYLSTKELTDNWKASVARTNKKLGLT